MAQSMGVAMPAGLGPEPASGSADDDQGDDDEDDNFDVEVVYTNE